MKRNIMSISLLGVVLAVMVYLCLIPKRFYDKVVVRDVYGDSSYLDNVFVKLEVMPGEDDSKFANYLYELEFKDDKIDYQQDDLFKQRRQQNLYIYTKGKKSHYFSDNNLLLSDDYNVFRKVDYTKYITEDLILEIVDKDSKTKEVLYEIDGAYIEVIANIYDESKNELTLLCCEQKYTKEEINEGYIDPTYNQEEIKRLVINLEEGKIVEEDALDLSKYLDEEASYSYWSGIYTNCSDQTVLILYEQVDQDSPMDRRAFIYDLDGDLKEITLPEDVEENNIFVNEDSLYAYAEIYEAYSYKRRGMELYKYNEKANKFEVYEDFSGDNFYIDRLNATVFISDNLSPQVVNLKVHNLNDFEVCYEATFELEDDREVLELYVFGY